jgi:hypothetical protein
MIENWTGFVWHDEPVAEKHWVKTWEGEAGGEREAIERTAETWLRDQKRRFFDLETRLRINVVNESETLVFTATPLVKWEVGTG